MPKKLFETERLNVYLLDASYASVVLTYYEKNQEHFKYSMPLTTSQFLTYKYQFDLMLMQNRNIQTGHLMKFWLFDKNDAHLGNIWGDVSLNNIVRGGFQSCHIGYKLDNDMVGKGIMSEALRRIIYYTFTEIKLHRIEANIMPTNQRSIKLIESLGFVDEGYSQNYLKINGKWEDHRRFALLNDVLPI